MGRRYGVCKVGVREYMISVIICEVRISFLVLLVIYFLLFDF